MWMGTTMTTEAGSITLGSYSHDLLLHDNAEVLVDGTIAFVQEGLASGGQVLVHSTEERVALLRGALGSHARLTYGLDRDLYQSPSTTLFAYQRIFEERTDATDVWVTGTVPHGEDQESHAAWARYESLVNEALGDYAFHALCTYDTQMLTPDVIAASRATHPHVGVGAHREVSHAYEEPADFLTDELAAVPTAPASEPTVTADVYSPHDLHIARRLLRRNTEPSDVSPDIADDLVTAAHEILVNGLEHGVPPARLELWVGPSKLTCRVTDRGRGIRDRLAGYRHPNRGGSMGLWAARQLCENIFVSNLTRGGCSVLLSTA